MRERRGNCKLNNNKFLLLHFNIFDWFCSSCCRIEKIVKERKTNVKLNKCTIVHAFPFVCVFDLILIVSHGSGSRIKCIIIVVNEFR